MESAAPSRGNGYGDAEEGISRVDLRTLMPETGLKEYWYPALLAKDVRKKPVLQQMLDKEICFWRGKSGVVAFDNACAHRGGMLHMGDCWWSGTISCFYHGWTYNEQGEVVAVLSEGPDCKIPGQVGVKVYPTVELHGVVFIWMGDGEPAPMEEDIPPEFFDKKSLIMSTIAYWYNCNWRPALENILDAHFAYMHRNSLRELIHPVKAGFPRARKPEVYKGRALVHRARGGGAPFGNHEPGDYQRFYPQLGQKWPRARWRFAWTWFFDLVGKRAPKKTLKFDDPEWAPGSEHLPGIFRVDHNYIFTRMVIPAGKEHTRLFYFQSSRPGSRVGRLWDMLVYYTYRNWLQNYNFSGQDGKGNTFLYFDRPEYLSATDIQTVMWRRLVLRARGMGARAPAPDGGEPSQPDALPEKVLAR